MNQARAERVRELFSAGAGMPPHERGEWLARECAGDDALRREVEELLSFDEGEAPPGEGGSPTVSPGMPDGGLRWLAAATAAFGLEPESTPTQIGPFRIIRRIGRGGMGTVYEAQQDAPERRVAIKVIRDGLVSAGLLRRFGRETRAMAQLRHPGIAQIFEVGTSFSPETGAVRPYFVMELVEGPTLLRFAEEEGLGMEGRLELVARVCEALHHAHQKGVIHRDLKPENILVQKLTDPVTGVGEALDPTVQPKILDFGVARFLEESGTASARTLAGQIVGTVPYLSPEQAVGRSSEADIRSDIYSVGVIAYELLGGGLPFDVRDMPLHAAVRTVLETTPRRLSADHPALRGDVETIVAKAMDREPARRYQSAADAAADIRRYLRNEPIAAREPSTAYLLRKFFQRRRALVIWSASTLVALVGALMLVSVLWARASAAEHEAVWQRYRSAMSAAGFALSKGEIGIARKQMDSADPRFRGWEYSHFESRLDQCERLFRPTVTGPFLIVPDGGRDGGFICTEPTSGLLVHADSELATPTPVDPRLRLWWAARAARNSQRLRVEGGVIYTPDATGNAIAHRMTPWRYPPEQEFTNACLSGDGSILGIVRRLPSPASIIIADLSTDSVREIPLAKGVAPMRLAISKDGRRFAVSTGFDQPLAPHALVFETASGEPVSSIDPLPSEARSLLLNADGSRLTAAFHGGPLGVWDIRGPAAQQLAFQPYDFDAVENLTANDEETLLAAGPLDGEIRILDATTLEIRYGLTGHSSEVEDVRFLPDGERLISAGRNGEVRRWLLKAPQERPMVLRGHTHLVHGVAIGETGNFVATGSWDLSVRLFDLADGAEIAAMRADTFVQALALSPDERLIATREFGGVVSLYDVAARRLLTRLDRPMGRLDMPAFDAHSRRVLTDFDPIARTATWWDIPAEAWVVTPSAQAAEVRKPPVSPSGAIAYTETRGQQLTAVICDLRTGKELLALEVRRPASESVVFSPDGRVVLVPDPNHNIRAYDLLSGQALGAFRGHVREVLAMTFSPDGTRLFSADYTGAIFVWDTATFDELTQLRGHEAHVRRLVVSRDGRTLVSASRDGTARVWHAATP